MLLSGVPALLPNSAMPWRLRFLAAHPPAGLPTPRRRGARDTRGGAGSAHAGDAKRRCPWLNLVELRYEFTLPLPGTRAS